MFNFTSFLTKVPFLFQDLIQGTTLPSVILSPILCGLEQSLILPSFLMSLAIWKVPVRHSIECQFGFILMFFLIIRLGFYERISKYPFHHIISGEMSTGLITRSVVLNHLVKVVFSGFYTNLALVWADCGTGSDDEAEKAILTKQKRRLTSYLDLLIFQEELLASFPRMHVRRKKVIPVHSNHKSNFAYILLGLLLVFNLLHFIQCTGQKRRQKRWNRGTMTTTRLPTLCFLKLRSLCLCFRPLPPSAPTRLQPTFPCDPTISICSSKFP